MSLKYEIKLLHSLQTASIRTKTTISNLPDTIVKSYGAIKEHLVTTGTNCSGVPFAIYYNMEINNLDVELGFPVAKNIVEKGEIKNSRVPGGKVVSFTHVGPYSELESSYNNAFGWIKQNMFKPNRMVCEFYLNDPDVTVPEDLITEINIYLLS